MYVYVQEKICGGCVMHLQYKDSKYMIISNEIPVSDNIDTSIKCVQEWFTTRTQ